MIDQSEALEIRYARARLAEHQARRAAAVKTRAAEWIDVYQREASDFTIADCDRQIARICAWLAAREAA